MNAWSTGSVSNDQFSLSLSILFGSWRLIVGFIRTPIFPSRASFAVIKSDRSNPLYAPDFPTTTHILSIIFLFMISEAVVSTSHLLSSIHSFQMRTFDTPFDLNWTTYFVSGFTHILLRSWSYVFASQILSSVLNVRSASRNWSTTLSTFSVNPVSGLYASVLFEFAKRSLNGFTERLASFQNFVTCSCTYCGIQSGRKLFMKLSFIFWSRYICDSNWEPRVSIILSSIPPWDIFSVPETVALYVPNVLRPSLFAKYSSIPYHSVSLIVRSTSDIPNALRVALMYQSFSWSHPIAAACEIVPIRSE